MSRKSMIVLIYRRHQALNHIYSWVIEIMLSRFMDATNNGVSDLMIGFIGLLVQSLMITINYNYSQ
jgi:hypothetical protein